MTSPAPARSTRFASLDGLRGVAAMVVVLYHVFEISRPYLITQSGSAPLDGITPYSIWVTTPLAILVAGQEAVYVFFVLSGFVLTLSVIRKRSFDWMGYYPSRLVRLYLPAIASIALSVLLILAVPRVPNTEYQGSWILQGALEIHPAVILREMSLTAITPTYNGVLWSLYLEVAFSVLLPMFVAFAVLTKRWWWAAVLAAFGLSAAGIEANDYGFMLLPVFFLGAVLAVKLPDLERFVGRINSWRAPMAVWLPALILGLMLLIPAIFVPVLFTIPHGWTIIELCWLVGAVLIVIVSFAWSPLVRLLETRVAAWFGKISFSLYLVHVPVLATLTFLWTGKNWGWVGLIGVPLSILVAWLFFLGVERPSHRLAQWISKRVRPAAHQGDQTPAS